MITQESSTKTIDWGDLSISVASLCLEFLYLGDYTLNDSMTAEDCEALLHAKTYANADPYMMLDLMELARTRFRTSLGKITFGDTATWTSVVDHIYSASYERADGLRCDLVEHFRSNL